MSKEQFADLRRTPQGVRGLKYSRKPLVYTHDPSHPARGAWIEMLFCYARQPLLLMSHPARGAWIEIKTFEGVAAAMAVAPRKGCVD